MERGSSDTLRPPVALHPHAVHETGVPFLAASVPWRRGICVVPPASPPEAHLPRHAPVAEPRPEPGDAPPHEAAAAAVPNLATFRSGLDRGRPALVEAAWLVLSALFVASFLPGSAHRRWLLALFGARIGRGVVVKPGVRVKFPWRLEVGDNAWLGEGAWIDNIVPVTIGANACVSQGAYLCTGNHDWSVPSFDLRAAPIVLADGAWVGARAVVGPGVTVGRGAIVALGAVAVRDVPERQILTAVAAPAAQRRTIRPVPSPITAAAVAAVAASVEAGA